jgi:hypothetical protein
MFNKFTFLTNIVIAFLFISPSFFAQNISFTEHLVDNNVDGPARIFIKDVGNKIGKNNNRDEKLREGELYERL